MKALVNTLRTNGTVAFSYEKTELSSGFVPPAPGVRALVFGIWAKDEEGKTRHIHWHLRVYVDGRLAISDDCRDQQSLLDTANKYVGAFHIVRKMGYELECDWNQLVDRAGEDF